MRFTEAAEARDRLEAHGVHLAESTKHFATHDVADIGQALAADIALVCAWTRHWEHACTELDAMLAAEKARAAAPKVYTPDNGQEAR